MKRQITTGLLLLSLCSHASPRHLNLQKALDLKLIKALVRSLGAYQGFCIQMELTNLSNDSLVVTLEAGRRLNSINDSEQDILVTQQQVIALNKQQKLSLRVKGYCCQASKHAPAQNALYGINRMAEDKLVVLAQYLDQHPNAADLEQQAIWAISDQRPLSTVVSMNDSVLPGLQLMVSSLKGEKIPWYAVVTKTLVYQSGAMVTIPVWLRGKLEYNNEQECYSTLHILNEEGMEVCQIVQQWLMPGNSQNYPLRIPLNGLPKGRYTIELLGADKTLARKEFEI